MSANYNTPAFEAPAASTKALVAGTASSNVQFQSNNLNQHIRIYNSGTTPAFVEFGESSVTAAIPSGTATGGMPIVGGGTFILRGAKNYVAAIVSAGTATLYVTPGNGGL